MGCTGAENTRKEGLRFPKPADFVADGQVQEERL